MAKKTKGARRHTVAKTPKLVAANGTLIEHVGRKLIKFQGVLADAGFAGRS